MHIRNHRHPEPNDPDSRPERDTDPTEAAQAELRQGLGQWRHHYHEGFELSEPVDPQRDHVCGNPASPVVVVEYGSYGSAGGSGEDLALRATLREWLDDGSICLAFRHFPLIDSHPCAWIAAQAAEAAGYQGRFWELHDALTTALTQPEARRHEGPNTIERHEILALARRLKFDVHRLEADMKSALAAERIFRDFNSGVRSGVNGTPTFYVQGVRQDIDEPAELHARLERALVGDLASLWPPTHKRVDRNLAAIARLWHDGLAKGDMSALAPFWADDVDWRGWNDDLPGGGTATGRVAVEDLHRRPCSAAPGFRAVAHDFIEHGNRVIVVGEADRDAGGGGFRAPYVQIWKMDAGKATSVHTLTDTLAIAQALDDRATREVPVAT